MVFVRSTESVIYIFKKWKLSLYHSPPNTIIKRPYRFKVNKLCFHVSDDYFYIYHTARHMWPLLFFISCGSSGRTAEKTSLSFKSDQVKVKQEPGTEEEVCSFSGAVKQEKTEDGRRSACMVKPPGPARGLPSGCAGRASAPVNIHSCLSVCAWYQPNTSL